MRIPTAATTLTTLDVVNLFSSAVSTVLAVVALVLSIFFFVQAKKDAERSAGAASEISSSVERLEKLFDSLYSDTLSMMRETVTDMRKHIWTAVPGRDGTKLSEEEGEDELNS